METPGEGDNKEMENIREIGNAGAAKTGGGGLQRRLGKHRVRIGWNAAPPHRRAAEEGGSVSSKNERRGSHKLRSSGTRGRQANR